MDGLDSEVGLFIGSSSEGEDVARNLQVVLSRACLVTRWNQGVFEPGGNALDSLIDVTKRVDFAVLIATPDDINESRGETSVAMRDNIVFEYGLFAGALGRKRVYMLATEDIKIPSDILGVTRLPYASRSDGNIGAALTEAGMSIEERIRALGPVARDRQLSALSSGVTVLERELSTLSGNAAAQGWRVKTDSPTTFRLRSPKGQVFTLTKGRQESTRHELRRFVAKLRAEGLRVNRSIRRPVEDSPFS
ncbi:nucleotide-binding protein [Brevibacterium sp. CFH 10365]|uniref:nucleotide-binding protein n=1 Tax=Brevibacterium sp. CFH 10365 TaxID=2585207 RepID=UPI0012668489